MTIQKYMPGCLDGIAHGTRVKLFHVGRISCVLTYDGPEPIKRLITAEGPIEFYSLDINAKRPKPMIAPIDLGQFVKPLDLSQFGASNLQQAQTPPPPVIGIPTSLPPGPPRPPSRQDELINFRASIFPAALPSEDVPPMIDQFANAEHTNWFHYPTKPPEHTGYYETRCRVKGDVSGKEFSAFSYFDTAKGSFSCDTDMVEIFAWRGLTQAGRDFLKVK